MCFYTHYYSLLGNSHAYQKKTLEIQLLPSLKQSLIAYCQPIANGPMDKVEHVVAMALAAIDGSDKGLKIKGVDNVKAAAKATRC